jgi:hypothetical protein
MAIAKQAAKRGQYPNKARGDANRWKIFSRAGNLAEFALWLTLTT